MVLVTELPERIVEPRIAAERLRTLRANAVGVALELVPIAGAPLRDRDDHRDKRIARVAVAADETTLLLELGSYECLAVLAVDKGPYWVFEDAHLALGVLAHHGIRPKRFGCTTVAATLLAEGADGRHDDRPLDRTLEEFFGRGLPPASAEEDLQRQRLGRAAEALVELMRGQTPLLREKGLAALFEFECSLLHTVLDMEGAGMPLDGGLFERVASAWVKERHELEQGDATAKRIGRLDKLISTYRFWARDFLIRMGGFGSVSAPSPRTLVVSHA